MTTDGRCLSPEVIAAFVEGRLPAAERAVAQDHLSTCESCRDVLADTARFAEEQVPSVPKGAIYWGQKTWMGLAAAAVVVLAWAGYLVWNTPERRADGVLASLASSSETTRTVQGRLHADFPWRPAPPITRGAQDAAIALDVQEALLTLRRLATDHPSARTIAAVGVAELVTGDIDGAITSLEAASARSDVDARIFADLSAARIERWRRTQAPADAAEALDAAERALMLTPADPVALFNHAIAVEALGMRDAAITRWQAYLTIDAASQWAAEAREHLARLQQEGRDSKLRRRLPAFVVPASLPSARRVCAERAVSLLAESRVAFDESRLPQADELATQARASLVCAGLPTADADAQLAWTWYFHNRAADAMPIVARLLAAPGGLSEGARGRLEYIQGLAAVRAGRYIPGSAAYARARDAFAREGDDELQGAVWALLSEAPMARGDREGAWAALAEGFPSLPVMSARRRHVILQHAMTVAQTFELAGAANFFADALVQPDDSRDPYITVAGLVQAVQTYLPAGQRARARDLLDRAAALLPAVPDEPQRELYRTEVELYTARVIAADDPRRAVELYGRPLQEFDPETLPLRRARVLLYRGRAFHHLGDVAAADRDWVEGAALFSDRRQHMRDQQWRVDSRHELWGLFRELIRVRADQPLGALEVAEQSRGRTLLDAQARGDMGLEPLQGPALHEWLPADTTVLAYAVLDDAVFRWTVTRGGVALERHVMSSSDLRRLVDAHAAAVAAGRLDGGAALAEVLLPETLDPTQTRRLVFLPDGPLYRVPFAVLPQRSTNRLVLDDFVPQVAPSLTMLRAAGKGASGHRTLLVASGEAQPGEGLAALPGVTKEIDAVRPLYPQSRVLVGRQATRDAFLSSIRESDLVHFAGHVVADEHTPSRSRLLMSPGHDPSAVTFTDLRSLSLPAGATVVLSACEGATGRVFVGEGAVGLPFVFLANGASSVVAALWQIDDASPPSLWVEVHKRLADGHSPAYALAEGQRMARQAGMSPSIWAAFTVIGGLVTP